MADGNNIFKQLKDYQNKAMQQVGLVRLGGGLLVFPPGLGGTTPERGPAPERGFVSGFATIPFTLFMPYKRSTGTAGMYSTTAVNPDKLFTNLPSPEFTIALPTPSSALKTNYSAEYSKIELGQAIGSTIDSVMGAVTSFGQGDFGGALSGIQKLGQGAGSVAKQATMALVGAALEAANSDKQLLNIAMGQADNPYSENVFQNVSFREHNFSYTFMPRNLKESETIDEIIQVFKYAMHPRPGSGALAGPGAYFDFPYEFQITHSIQSTTFTLMPSVLESFDVDYSGGADTPKLFKLTDSGQQFPAKITIAMKFKEMVLLSRDRILLTSHQSGQESGRLDSGAGRATMRFRF